MLAVFKVGVLGSSQTKFAYSVKKMPPLPPSSVSGYGAAQKISETSTVDLKANKVLRVKRKNTSLVIIILAIFILESKIQNKTGFYQCTNSSMFSMRRCNFRQIILFIPNFIFVLFILFMNFFFFFIFCDNKTNTINTHYKLSIVIEQLLQHS